jgi:hypothetical protein
MFRQDLSAATHSLMTKALVNELLLLLPRDALGNCMRVAANVCQPVIAMQEWSTAQW